MPPRLPADPLQLLDSFSEFDRSVRIGHGPLLICPHCGSARPSNAYFFPHTGTCIMAKLLQQELSRPPPSTAPDGHPAPTSHLSLDSRSVL